jgi:hypothetical protein
MRGVRVKRLYRTNHPPKGILGKFFNNSSASQPLAKTACTGSPAEEWLPQWLVGRGNRGKAFPHTERSSRDRPACLTNKQTTTTYAENMSPYSVGRKKNQTTLPKQHDCNKVGAIIRNVMIKKVEKIWRQHEYVEKKRRK